MKVAKSVLLILCVGLSTLFVAGDATAKADVSCHNIKAKGVGQDQGGGATTARIIGGGLLHGTTVGEFRVTGDPPIFALTGTVVFTTNNATLTVTITEGTFNVVSGEFSATGSVTDATGQLAGATGNLLFEGIEDLSDGTFIEDVTGQICVDLGP